MKTTIISEIPNNINEINWIIKQVGEIIFGDIWEEFENNLIKKSEIRKTGINILHDILYCNEYNSNETKYLLDYLFSELIKKKNKLSKD